MAQEKPIQPPLREAVREFQTPAPSVVFYTEQVDRLDVAYQQVAPIKRGTLYSTIQSAKQDVIDQYPNLYFVKENRVGVSDRFVVWTWATVPDAEDTYNAEVSYLSESEPHPIFARVYTIRRDQYDEFPTLDIGSKLTGLIAIKVEAQGLGYSASDPVEIASPIGGRCAAASLVVDPDGKVISVVVTDEGYLYVEPPDIQINSGTGQGAQLTGIIQPQTAYLISQKKQELPPDDPLRNEFVRVMRVYETLPGPTLYSTRLDIDGSIVTVGTTRKLCTDITTGEAITDGIWCKTTKKETDSYFVCDEVVECRPIPGLPMFSDALEVDGKFVVKSQQYVASANVLSQETLVDGIWTQKYFTDVDGTNLVSWQWVTVRQVPGNPVPYTKLDEDGKAVSGIRTLKKTSDIVTAETLVGTTWTKTTKEFLTTRLTIGEEASDLVSWEVVESRDIPGNALTEQTIDARDGDVQTVTRTMFDASAITPVESILGGNTYHTVESKPITELVAWKVITERPLPGAVLDEETVDDRDGAIQSVTRRLFDASTIIPSESIVGGVTYRKVEAKPITDILAWRVVTDRPVPGNNVVKTTIDADGDIVTETRTIVIGPPTLVTTITTAGGVYTKTFGEPINDLISWKVVQVKATQNELDSFEQSIPDLIPPQFRGVAPLVTTEQTLIGTASLPTLATGDIMRRQAQINFNTYRLTISGRAGISLPKTLTDQELTTEFGGGKLNVVMTLDTVGALTIDEGLLVVSSEIKNLGNGLAVKTTRQLDDSAWPILPSRLWDENTRQEYDETSQIVLTGTAEDTNPGVFGWVSEVKAKDKWHAQKVNISKASPVYVDEASALITYDYRPYRFPGYLVLTLSGLGYYVRAAHADLVQQKIRTWWITSTNPPTPPAVDEIIMDNPIISTLNNITTLAYAGECLHDTFTSFGVFIWPATTPSYTTYVGTWIGTERVIAATVTAEREKDVWKIQTRSVVMR